MSESNLSKLRIVFLGTPEFAVASLDALVKAGCHIVGVVTAPDKAAGRGMKMQESPVKKYAEQHHLYILQPEKLKNPAFTDTLRALNADLQIVVAFRMLPEVVWNMPPMGTINLHGSLLPQYRGAAPINWAVINGEKKTGVTTFKLKHEIDTGDILLQDSFAIGDNETAGEVHDRMKDIGAQLLVKTVEGLANGTLTEKSQESGMDGDVLSAGNEKTAGVATGLHATRHELKHAPKIFTETCHIDWHQPVDKIHNLIRGLSPYPGAFTELTGKGLKIFRSEKETCLPASRPGKWETDKKTYLKFAAPDGYILVKELQLEGKKRMGVEEFLRGYRF